MMLRSIWTGSPSGATRARFLAGPTRPAPSLTQAPSLRHRNMSSSTGTPNPIPASFLRGGTSKGIFLNKAHLPSDHKEWDKIFLGIMGSPDPRQLNGMGGGISSLSKICVVGAPTAEQAAEGIQAEYTFVQVGINDTNIDYSGNCGNLSSMVGVFAVDEGICEPTPVQHQDTTRTPRATVRLLNTNTQIVINTTFPISTSDQRTAVLDLPEVTMAGVPGQSSEITLEFVNPAGARTGKLLPTNSPLDHVEIVLPTTQEWKTVTCSCVDATNPTVFVSHAELSTFLPITEYYNGTAPTSARVAEVLEAIRQGAAIKMGLDPKAQAQPKIAILSDRNQGGDAKENVDLVIHALSMGVLHKAVPMTVGLCAGVAANIKGSLPWTIVQASPAGGKQEGAQKGMVRLRHPSGLVDVGAEFAEDGSVKSAKVVRTGKRLMKGVVWW